MRTLFLPSLLLTGLVGSLALDSLPLSVHAAEDEVQISLKPPDPRVLEAFNRDVEHVRRAVETDSLEQVLALQNELAAAWSHKDRIYYGELMVTICHGLAGRGRFGITAGALAADEVAMEVLENPEGISPESQLMLSLCLRLGRPDLAGGEKPGERQARAKLLSEAWQRLQEEIDEDFDFSNAPSIGIAASLMLSERAGVKRGVLTKDDQKIIDANTRLGIRYARQRSLHDTRSRYRDAVASCFALAYAESPDSDEALRSLLTKNEFSREMIEQVFAKLERRREDIKPRVAATEETGANASPKNIPPTESEFEEKRPRVEIATSEPAAPVSPAVVTPETTVATQALYVAPGDDAEYVAALVGKPRKLPGLEKVEKAVQRRIKNLREGGHVDEALIEARGFFNVCSTERTGRAVDLIAKCLVEAHPDDPGIAKRFRLDQLAMSYEWQKRVAKGGLDGPSLLDRPAPDSTVVATVPGPLPDYEVIIAQISGDDFDSRLARANVLLIAQRLPEARDELLAAYRIASDKQIPAATQGLARLIRAEDGHVGRANAWLLSIRPAP